MRKENSGFRTAFVSEEGSKLINHDYFAFMELDNLACYVVADGLDEDDERRSAQIVTKSILREFLEHPSISKRAIRRYLRKAQKELLQDKEGIRLRACVSLIITDYTKFRYASVGNSRAMVIRNERILYGSRDQSLTANLAEAERIPKDKVAIHEERNNLYSYLGQIDKKPDFQISPKKKLENGDVLILCTRGVWENFTESEFLDCVRDTSTPEELADNAEEFILARQQKEVDNFTIAAVFVDKTYLSPRKKLGSKQILVMAVPIFILLLVLGIALFIRHRNRKEKREDMEQGMESAAAFMELNNFEKAKDEYQAAKELAEDLEDKDKEEHLGNILLLLEQILLSEQAMAEEDYEKAQDLYYQAKKLSANLAGIQDGYLNRQLSKIEDYLRLYELLEAGERKEEYADYSGAIEEYKKAKELAADLYDKETRKEALEKQQAAEETLETLRQDELAALEEKIQQVIVDEQAAEELNRQKEQNDQKNALELESKGNELMNKEDYLSAITYFETAMKMYEDLGMTDRLSTLEEKIKSCKILYEQAKAKAAQEAEEKAAEEAEKKAELDKAAEEARKAAEEAKKAAEEAKKSVSQNSTGGNT